MHRRTFLAAAAAAASPQAPQFPIIDSHIHLFDPTRPEGVPWPGKGDGVLYRPALPDRYRALAAPLGITGAIEVECSTWLEDNQWVLDTAAHSPIMVGTVGNLDPASAEFPKQLERFHRNPLFRGIRYGNLWDRDFAADAARPKFVAGMKLLVQAGLVLDTANPNPALIETVVRLSDRVPGLRIVIDHLPQCNPPTESRAVTAWQANLRELGKRPQVYCKLSGILRRVDGKVPETLDFYRERLDELYGTFGEDRVLFGSDWPNCDQWAPIGTVLALARAYFASKTPVQAEKYFWKNSAAAYRWTKRDPV